MFRSRGYITVILHLGNYSLIQKSTTGDLILIIGGIFLWVLSNEEERDGTSCTPMFSSGGRCLVLLTGVAFGLDSLGTRTYKVGDLNTLYLLTTTSVVYTS